LIPSSNPQPPSPQICLNYKNVQLHELQFDLSYMVHQGQLLS
jgi:hypothetical protein